MNTLDFTNIKAVAFDIDGTLYRSGRFYFRIFPYFVIHNKFFFKYGVVRKILRESPLAIPNFEKEQSIQMAKKLNCSPDEAQTKLEKIVYKGLCKYFVHISPCKGVISLINRLKQNGYKIGILSDFPPEQKGSIWGIKELCDVCLGSEKTGALKPSPVPFLKLAEELNLKPAEILYVGNNLNYDVIGAKNIGMKTAWIITSFAKLKRKKSSVADITFVHYKELEKQFFGDITV